MKLPKQEKPVTRSADVRKRMMNKKKSAETNRVHPSAFSAWGSGKICDSKGNCAEGGFTYTK